MATAEIIIKQPIIRLELSKEEADIIRFMLIARITAQFDEQDNKKAQQIIETLIDALEGL